MEQQHVQALIAEAARAAAAETIAEAFIKLGLDPQKPIESQSAFATLRYLHSALNSEEVKKDIAFVRSFRVSFQKATTKTLLVLCTALFTMVSSGISYALSWMWKTFNT